MHEHWAAEFWVKLIKVNKTKDETAREDLQANCTHVGNNFWLFEGDEEFLDEGIDFTVIDEVAILAYGGLSSEELKTFVFNYYGVNVDDPQNQ